MVHPLPRRTRTSSARMPGALAVVLLLVFAAAAHPQDPCAELTAEAAEIAALRDSDTEAGIAAARAGVERAALLGCPEAKARMLCALGDNLNVAGRHSEAIAAYQAAQGVLRPLGESVALVSALRREGVAHASAGDLAVAAERSLAALRMAETLGAVGEAAMTASTLGTVHSRLGEFERARAYLEEAHAGFLAAGNRVSAAGTGINLGSLLLRRADRLAADGDEAGARSLRQEARRYNLKALDQFEALDHPRGLAIAAGNAGAAAALLGDHESALALHRRALPVREQVGDREGQATTHLHIATASIPLGRFAEAESNLRAAEALTPETGLTLRLGIAEQWVALEEARGLPGAALERMRDANRIREAITAADHQARVAEIQAQFDTAQQARELERLRHEWEMGELRLARQRAFILGGGTVLLLVLVLLAAMSAWYRQSRRHARALELVARTDELTGLPNRRDARDRIEYELGRAARSGQPVSLALVDIDDFKTVNDAFGHDVGDRVLVAMTRRLRSQLRRQDILMRWGGDEFLILLPETGGYGAQVLTEKLDLGLVEDPVQVDGRRFPLSVSIGVFECGDGQSVDECVRWADAAMYQVKRARKDQLEISLE